MRDMTKKEIIEILRTKRKGPKRPYFDGERIHWDIDDDLFLPDRIIIELYCEACRYSRAIHKK